MKLFRITITAYKSFYVEANDQDGAYENEFVHDESSGTFSGEFDWETDEITAEEMDESYAKFVREQHPEKIIKVEEDASSTETAP